MYFRGRFWSGGKKIVCQMTHWATFSESDKSTLKPVLESAPQGHVGASALRAVVGWCSAFRIAKLVGVVRWTLRSGQVALWCHNATRK